jgi:hypothetical protein
MLVQRHETTPKISCRIARDALAAAENRMFNTACHFSTR